MNINIAKLQAQLQGLSPQQIQMAVQGGSVPPWLAAVEQQRRMDLSKRMQSATPPRSTVVQDMQAPQGIQAYAGGGGVKRKRTPEEERTLGIMKALPFEQFSELGREAYSPSDFDVDGMDLYNEAGISQLEKFDNARKANTSAPTPLPTKEITGIQEVAPSVTPDYSPNINPPPDDMVMVQPAQRPNDDDDDIRGQIIGALLDMPDDQFAAVAENKPNMTEQDARLFDYASGIRRNRLTDRLQTWAYGSPEAAAAAQPNPELTAGLRQWAKDESPAVAQAGINQIGDLRDSENLMNDPEVYAKEAAQETNQPQGIQQVVAPQETLQPQAQPLPIKEQLAPVQQAVTPVPLNAPEEDAGIAKLAQTPPQAPARVSTPEQTYAATATPDSYSQGLAKLRKATPDSYSQGLAKLRKAMEIDNPMPEIRTKESEKNVKEREAQRQDVEDNNLGWSVMQAAAAMMAGDSPYASVNIGQGALAGLQKYAEGKKTIRDLGKDINALQADRETALNSRDYQKYTQKQNQLAMMTELAERAQQAELQRQSVEGIHQLDRESAERMAKDRNAAMLKAAGLRGAGSGGGNLDDYLRTASSLITAETNIDKEFNDQKNIINADLSLSKDEKAVAIMQLERATNARKAEIIGMREAMKARAGMSTIGGAGVINAGDLPPNIKPLPPEKGEARSNGKPTWADYNNLVKERDRLYELKNKGAKDPTEYKNIEAEIKKIEAEINRIHPLIPR